MNAEQLQTAAFEIILSSGNGRTLTHEAFKLMREGKHSEAEAKLEEANGAFVEAHNAQTELLHAYANGGRASNGNYYDSCSRSFDDWDDVTRSCY